MLSVRFEDPYDHINYMYNTHEDTYIIVAQEHNTEDAKFEIEELFEETNENIMA